MGDDTSERNKRMKENHNLCMKIYMQERRKNRKKAGVKIENINNNKIESEKDIKDRQKYMKNYNKKKMGYQEPKIKDIGSYIANINKYPANFPKEEFKKKLDEILKYEPAEIKEKTLKDVIYDILDKKEILTPAMIIRVYHNSDWTDTIGEFMQARNYMKNGDEKYIPIQK